MLTTPDQTPYRSLARQVTANMLSADILALFPACRAWLEAHTADLREWQIALPLAACLAAGGSTEDGLAVASAWCSFCLAAVILDNVEDGEFTPDDLVSTAGQAANLGTALIFLCFHHLAAIQDPGGAAHAGAVFSGQGFSATGGQARSLAAAPSTALSVDEALEAYWQEIILKSGCVYRAAAAGGAAAGGADESVMTGLGKYGTAMGVIVQLLDDGADLLKTSEEDVIEAWEVSLPLLLYLLATGEQQVVFPAAHTRAEWQARLREAGVVEAFSAILLQWQARALESLQGLSLSPEGKKMLEEFPVLILEPVVRKDKEKE